MEEYEIDFEESTPINSEKKFFFALKKYKDEHNQTTFDLIKTIAKEYGINLKEMIEDDKSKRKNSWKANKI